MGTAVRSSAQTAVSVETTLLGTFSGMVGNSRSEGDDVLVSKVGAVVTEAAVMVGVVDWVGSAVVQQSVGEAVVVIGSATMVVPFETMRQTPSCASMVLRT